MDTCGPLMYRINTNLKTQCFDFKRYDKKVPNHKSSRDKKKLFQQLVTLKSLKNKTKQKILDLESIYNWCIILLINYLGPFLGGSSASSCLARGHLGQINF